MEDRLSRLEEKQDSIIEKVGEMAINTAANTASLKEHMSQTVEVRKQTEMLFEGLKDLKEDMDARLKPLDTFVDRAKFLGAVAGVAGTLLVGAAKLGLISIIQHL